jgi:hypothetical protein
VDLILAALRAKNKNENPLPPDPGRDRPKTSDFLTGITIRTIPRDPPRGGGAKNKIRNRLWHSQVLAPPPPGGSRGRDPSVISAKKTEVLGQCRPGSGGSTLVSNIRFLGRPDIADFGGLGGPGGPENHSRRWGAKPPLSGMVFGALRAAQTRKINDFRPAQKPCIKNPSVMDFKFYFCMFLWPRGRPDPKIDDLWVPGE